MIPTHQVIMNNLSLSITSDSDSSTSSQIKTTVTSLIKSASFKYSNSSSSKNNTPQSKKSPLHIESSLHAICKTHPCITDVESQLSTSNNAAHMKDSNGKLPLHTACEYGASVEVIETLVDEYTSATMIHDRYGKLPIHHLCESYMRNSSLLISEDDAIDDFLSILEILLYRSSNCLLKLDGNGMSAVEHAIVADLDYDIVYSLQKATEKLLKSRNEHGVKD